MTKPELTASELKLIDDAARYLERPTLMIELAETVGKPVDVLMRSLNRIAPDKIERAVGSSLRTALKFAVATIPEKLPATDEELDADINSLAKRISLKHKLTVAFTGGVGGMFGGFGLAAELPITTTIMFRSIASIAQRYGEDLRDPASRLQCLSVFSFGSGGRSSTAECAYLATRLSMQASLAQATRVLTVVTADELTGMIQKGTAPALLNLLSHIAAQFNVAVTQKTLAQALPLVGSATGAIINVALIDHFNRVAKFHFGIRRLERKYGLEPVQLIYQDAARQVKQDATARRLTLRPSPGF